MSSAVGVHVCKVCGAVHPTIGAYLDHLDRHCPVSIGAAHNFTQDMLVCNKLRPCPDHDGRDTSDRERG